MKKEELNFTEEQKKELIVKTEHDFYLKEIVSWKNFVKGFSMLIGVVGVISLVAATMIGVMTSDLLLIPYVVTACCLVESIILGVMTYNVIKNKNCFNKKFKDKITYKQYRQLEKSGEIDRLRKEYKDDIKAYWYKNRGITVEDYNRMAEDDIIHDVKEKLKNDKITEIDSARVVSEVKRIIDENNEK